MFARIVGTKSYSLNIFLCAGGKGRTRSARYNSSISIYLPKYLTVYPEAPGDWLHDLSLCTFPSTPTLSKLPCSHLFRALTNLKQAEDAKSNVLALRAHNLNQSQSFQPYVLVLLPVLGIPPFAKQHCHRFSRPTLPNWQISAR